LYHSAAAGASWGQAIRWGIFGNAADFDTIRAHPHVFSGFFATI